MKRLFAIITFLGALMAANAAVPQIVAHRGYHRADGSAQNSIRALVKADSIKADACEFDVWLSADDVLYVNHNADINGVVLETSDSATLDKQKLGNGEILPRLDAFLDVAKGLDIDLVLEIKPHKDNTREDVAVPMIVKMVADKGLTDRTSYITFSRHAFDLLVAQSGRPVLYLNGVSPEVLKEIGGSGADYHINVFRKNPDWIGKIHANGMPVNIWTVDSEADIRWCIEHGADLITTNEPELAQKLVKEYFGEHKLKIMSYNLRFGELASLERLAQEIKEQNPDFVALQEVDVYSRRKADGINNGKNYINELAQMTGMFGFYGRTINLGKGDPQGYYGIGILSKHPAVSVEEFELPNPEAVEPRVLLKGKFLIGGHLPIIFASTHLDYKSKETAALQAKYLLPILCSDGIPAIVGGDFNCTPDQEAIQIMLHDGKMLTGLKPTFPSHAPHKRLDFLFGYPAADFTVDSTGEGPAGPDAASDHLPVYSTITVDYSK